MKITTKSKNAVLAILDIALYSRNNEVVNISDISKRQNISTAYLEQLLSKLRRANILKSIKGPGGGYIIAKDLDQVNIYQIINIVNDNIDATNCKGKSNCHNNKQCLAHSLWDGLTHHIHDYLAKITLSDLTSNTQPYKVIEPFIHRKEISQ
jgi:Rrf2 family iron-sulfur cluster assembly transcriptional regulator